MAEQKKDLVLDIKDLVIHYETDDGVVEAVKALIFSWNTARPWGLWGRRI